MGKLEKDKPTPLHVQLSDIIREKIYSQEWGADMKLPSEHEFMSMYDISRGTVQKGIQLLVNEGLLTRIKGKGTFVTKPNIEQLSGSSLLSFAESLRMQNINFETRVLGMDIIAANEICSRKLSIPLNSPVLFLRRVRATDSGPILYMESRLNLFTCPGLDKYDYSTTTLFSAIEEVSHKKISYAKVRYGARIAGRTRAEILECDEKAPVLNIDQVCYLEDNSTTDWGNIWLPANKYILVSVLQRV
jgi:DNA-binding GntR family transcriptional regulator